LSRKPPPDIHDNSNIFRGLLTAESNSKLSKRLIFESNAVIPYEDFEAAGFLLGCILDRARQNEERILVLRIPYRLEKEWKQGLIKETSPNLRDLWEEINSSFR